MRRLLRFLLPLSIVAMLAFPAVASATHEDDPRSANVVPLGESLQPGSFLVPEPERTVNSDLAFWGNLVYHGNYDGFRIVDISDPRNPQLVSWTRCNADQGDVVVWQNILVRSWNTKRSTPRNCDGATVPAGFEGVHIFDISNKQDPRLVGQVELPCGSHTATLAGISNNRLIVYSNISSSGGCGVGLDRAGQDALGDFMDVIAIPLDNPAGASLIHREPLEGPTDPRVRTGCHDVAVFRANVNLAVCASADTTNVFDIGANARPGGSIEDPEFMFTIREPGVDGLIGRWHSAALSWNGEIIILGWEPGGGGQAECEATDPPVKKSLFFYSAENGAKLGQWTLPRPQGPDENCTIHNYNVVPFKDRHVLVQGSYQSGWSAVNFTNPGAAFEFAWSDPPSLGPGPFCSATRPPGCQLGGAWSTYWYNDLAVESDITNGLRLYTVAEPWWRRAFDFPRLNPQTQEFTFSCAMRVTTSKRLRARQSTTVTIRVRERATGQPVPRDPVILRGPGIRVRTETNEQGVARVRGITATRRGRLTVTMPAEVNMQGCRATRGILAAKRPARPAGVRLTGGRA